MNLIIHPFNEEYKEKVIKYYKNHYQFHPGDVGLDLFCLNNQTIPAKSFSNKIHLGIFAEAYHIDRSAYRNNGTIDIDKTYEHISNRTGYFLFPRSSTGLRTPLRLSNSVGIIDKGYRGELIAIVDNLSDEDFTINPGERYFQITSPELEFIVTRIEIDDKRIICGHKDGIIRIFGKDDSEERKEKGLGSTGI